MLISGRMPIGAWRRRHQLMAMLTLVVAVLAASASMAVARSGGAANRSAFYTGAEPSAVVKAHYGYRRGYRVPRRYFRYGYAYPRRYYRRKHRHHYHHHGFRGHRPHYRSLRRYRHDGYRYRYYRRW